VTPEQRRKCAEDTADLSVKEGSIKGYEMYVLTPANYNALAEGAET